MREAATIGARPVQRVMDDFVAWVRGLPGPRMFAAFPIAFDGTWMDFYLRRFTCHGVAQGPYESNVLFEGSGLCLRSYAAAVTGLPVARVSPQSLPAAWLGGIEHSHRAIDDARGYARLLGVLLGGASPLS